MIPKNIVAKITGRVWGVISVYLFVRAMATLSRLRAKVLGLVLNEGHSETSRYYYYYGNCRKYYGGDNGKSHA